VEFNELLQLFSEKDEDPESFPPEIFNTSSLDQNLTTQVVNAIRDNYEGKMVIIVAHRYF
jgi:hypothetical protein